MTVIRFLVVFGLSSSLNVFEIYVLGSVVLNVVVESVDAVLCKLRRISRQVTACNVISVNCRSQASTKLEVFKQSFFLGLKQAV
jgi:hypothetical protein